MSNTAETQGRGSRSRQPCFCSSVVLPLWLLQWVSDRWFATRWSINLSESCLWTCSRNWRYFSISDCLHISRIAIITHKTHLDTSRYKGYMPQLGTSMSFFQWASGCGVPTIKPQVSGYNRIVNGENAVSGSWPWQVSLQVTLVMEKFTLTPHCSFATSSKACVI